MNQALHIASASDAGYFPSLEVMIASTLRVVDPATETHFYIFDGGIPAEKWPALQQLANRFHRHATIHALRFAADRFAGFTAMHGNHLTYARLLLGECLPHLDKIIYLDSDLIVLASPEALRDRPMHGKIALAATDAVVKNLGQDCPWLPSDVAAAYPYFNAGVLVMDLQQWREKHLLEECLSAIAAKDGACRFWDQTALNYILRDDVEFIESRWNCVAFASDQITPETAILHLISDKPWRNYMPRFDHYLWRAFYTDNIEAGREWAPHSPLANKVLFHLAGTASTQWLFRLLMKAMIARTKDDNLRARRASMLQQGSSDLRLLRKMRRGWRTSRPASSPATSN